MKKAHQKVHRLVWLLLLPLLCVAVYIAMENRVDPMPAFEVIDNKQKGGSLP